MQKIKIRNPEILKRLDQWNEFFFEQDYSMLQDKKTCPAYRKPFEDAVSDEYLEWMMSKKIGPGDLEEYHEGFPESMYGHAMNEFFMENYDEMWNREVDKIILDLNQILVSRNNALCAYYPPGGYIGWHTNWNAPGYNILLTYSKTGDGYFKYLDKSTGKKVVMEDEPGVWTAKVGYYGNEKEEDKHVWHCAATECDRFTFSYVIPDQTLWKDMIADLEDPDF